MPRGGKRPGAGRRTGAKNKNSADLQALAQPYTPEALAVLHQVMTSSQSDAARVAAAKELLDRGHGRAHQTSSSDVTVHRMVARLPTAAKTTEEWLQTLEDAQRPNGHMDA